MHVLKLKFFQNGNTASYLDYEDVASQVDLSEFRDKNNQSDVKNWLKNFRRTGLFSKIWCKISDALSRIFGEVTS